MFSDTHVRSHSDCTQKLEHYLSHLTWNDTLIKTLDNRAYPVRIAFLRCFGTPMWPMNVIVNYMVIDSLVYIYLSICVNPCYQ